MPKTRGVYEHPAGSGIWWAQYFVNGKRHRERAGNKTNAGKLYRKRKTQALLGEKFPELRRRRVTFGELIDDAIAFAKEHNERSARDYIIKGNLLKASLGTRRAEDLSPDELSDWIKARKVCAATFNRYRAFLSLCFREGMIAGKVKVNTARLIHQKQESKGRKRYLSREEYDVLLDAIRKLFPQHVDAFITSIFSGMRLSEQFTVQWGQIDFERSEINLSRTKNGEDRTVTMNSLVRTLLWGRKARSKARRGDVVFPGNTAGGRVDTRPWFKPAMKTAGIEGYVWHSNRHTFCSWLAMAGVPLKTIQELAGHKTISITAQYAHLCPAHVESELEKMLTPPAQRNVISIASAIKTAIGDQPTAKQIG